MEENNLKNKKAFIILLSSQLLFLLLLLPWFLFAGLSVMMFDTPGSERDVTTLTIFFTILAYPLGVAVSILTSWIAYARSRYKAAYWCAGIPLFWVIPIALFWGYALLS
ncbi:hypothetical protein EV586_101342 [Tumebacillus sp. BK434]|uniref:hypothetical protein n=1 Tax=Tumebacillus sp. BK434 TaxID=2512169 RepID=UPI00104EAF0B|nr:hypothetical protein [Tumebacillus sp. BK434]TCP59126.1 hypothetical protein EV586_101342 [Tumebacillus sp. BK434]